MRSTRFRVAVLAAAVLLAALTVSSCDGRIPASLPMDQNPVFSGGIGWIVVAQAYVRVKDAPDLDAPDAGHLRGGEVLAVLGRERDPRSGNPWYRVEVGGTEGWILGDQAVFFEGRAAAERAASRYR